MWKKRSIHQPKPIILCADFETSTAGVEYAKRNNDTFIYAMSVIRVPLYDDVLKKENVDSKVPWKPLKFVRWNYKPNLVRRNFGTWEDFLDYLLNKMEIGKDQQIMLYFHNGQKFDFVFIQRWLINNHWLRCLTPKQIEEAREKHLNYYEWETTQSWNAGVLYFWVEKIQGYITLELRDTIKIQPGTIEEIGKDLMKSYGDDIKSNPWFKDFNLVKVTEFNNYLDYIQDLKGDLVVCKDGTTFNIHNPKEWPEILAKRVSGDTEIMVVLLYYYILNQIINPVDYHADICLTTGQVAVKSFYEEIWHTTEHPEHTRKDLYETYYGSTFTQRVNEYLQLTGKWGEDIQAPSIVRGGFTNGMDEVKGKVMEGYFDSKDINSLYPFIACGKCPYGAGTHSYTLEEMMEDKNLWGVIWVKAKHVKQLVRNVPAMIPVKFVEEDEDVIGHYTYECGDFFGCFTKQEWTLVFGRENYFEWEDMEVVEYLCYATRPILKHFMETNYLAKQKASKEHNHSAKTVAKLKLNSLTGKFGQKLYKFKKIDPDTVSYETLKSSLDDLGLVDDDVKETLSENSFRYDWAKKHGFNILIGILSTTSKFVHTGLYAYITGGGRAYIQTIMLRLGSMYPNIKILYGDTDSMKIWYPNQETQNKVREWMSTNHLVDDTVLGAFKEEWDNQVKQFKYLCPKKYISADKDGNVLEDKSAMSGIKWSEIHNKLPQPHINDFYLGQTFKTLKPYKTKSGVLLIPTDYELKD